MARRFACGRPRVDVFACGVSSVGGGYNSPIEECVIANRRRQSEDGSPNWRAPEPERSDAPQGRGAAHARGESHGGGCSDFQFRSDPRGFVAVSSRLR